MQSSRHYLAPVPDEPDRPAVDIEHVAVLVAAQLQRAEASLVRQAPPAPPAARQYGGYVAAGAGAAVVIIPMLLATTAALLAAGMAALSLAVTALVIRWIIRDMRRG